MKNLLLLAAACAFSVASLSQNTGIGTTNPTDAKLQVEMAGNAAQGSFTNGITNISLLTEQNRPAIGLNLNYNAGYKYKGAGWGGLFYYYPSNGDLSYYSSNASGIAGANLAFGSRLFTIQADGNVGVGATPTEAKLQVHEPAGNTQFIAAAGNNLPGISAFVPVSSPSIGFNARFQSGYKFMGTGYGSFFQYSPSTGKLVYWNSTASGSADAALSSSSAFTVDNEGRIGIGTQNPNAPLHVTGNIVFGSSSISPAAGYKVSIDGKVIMEEARVQLSGSWPDYVFSNNYRLTSIAELDKYIQRHKHLPNMPSAADVEKQKGFDLGDIQKRMLEKIEELTLYVIQLKKENEGLQQRIEVLEKK